MKRFVMRAFGAMAIVAVLPSSGRAQAVAAQFVSEQGQAVRPLTVRASAASGEVLDRPAALTVDRLPLALALAQLHQTSGVPLLFSPNLMPIEKRVSCACADLTVRAALARLLRGTWMEYTVTSGVIVVGPSDVEEMLESLERGVAATVAGSSSASLGAGLKPVSLEAPARAIESGAWAVALQTATITGRIIDGRTQGPLVGVQVDVRGRGIGTLTGSDGRYALRNVPVGDIALRAQIIGYGTVERQVRVTGGQAVVQNFELTPEAVRLNELIVTGTPGATQRRAVGNVVTRISAAEVQEVAPATNVSQLLNARAPGVVLEQRAGQTGAGPQIRIRGSSTFSLSDQPLIYIDGVRVDNRINTGPDVGRGANISRLNDINPADIESIEVIKGPAAATLYGTEAASGVIQIITKRGRQSDRPEYTFSIRGGANWVMNPEGRFPPVYEKIGPEIVAFNVVQSETDRGTPLFKTGPVQGYGASLRGGTDVIQYYASGDYDRQTGTMDHDQTNRLTLRGNFSLTPSDALTITATQGFTRFRTSFGLYQVIWDAWSAMPSRLDKRRGFYGASPEAYRNNEIQYQEVDRFINSLQVQHEPTRWFTHRVTAGLDVVQEEDVELQRRADEVGAVFFGNTARGRGSKTEKRIRTGNVTLDYSATVSANLRESLGSKTSGGLQYYAKDWEVTSATGQEFAAHGLETIGAAARTTATGDYVQDATVGVFVQEQLAWRDRVFLTAGLRADDNSAFGENFNFVLYPKASATWVLSEEPFWQVAFANALKLRAAFGLSGQQPATYAALRTYTPVGSGAGVPGFVPSAVGNPDLGPEKGEEVELGFEMGMLEDRIAIDFTWYRQRTRDAILSRNVAPSTGFAGTQFINAGEIKNSGVELLLTGRVLETEKLSWDLGLNFSANQNRIVHLGGEKSLSLDMWHMHVPGFPVGSYFMKKIVSAELDAKGVAQNVMCDGGPENDHRPMPCATAPRVYLGPSSPTKEGGITSTLGFFGNVRLRVTADFKRGHLGENGDWRGRCSVRRLCLENHYPERYDPALIASIQRYPDLSSYVVEDASFAKLREVGLNFTVPDRWARRLKASRASVTAAARNLHTWTNYWGWEPETFATSAGNETMQINRYNKDIIPIPAQFRLDVNLSY